MDSYIANKVLWGVVSGGEYAPLYSQSRNRRNVPASTSPKTRLSTGGSVANTFRKVGEASASRSRCTLAMTSATSDVSKAVLSSGDSGRCAGRISLIVGDWRSLYT